MAVRPTDGAAMTARGPREFVTTDPRQRIEKCGKGGLLRGHGGSRLCGAAASSVTCFQPIQAIGPPNLQQRLELATAAISFSSVTPCSQRVFLTARWLRIGKHLRTWPLGFRHNPFMF
jgi:hypothetical protein